MRFKTGIERHCTHCPEAIYVQHRTNYVVPSVTLNRQTFKRQAPMLRV